MERERDALWKEYIEKENQRLLAKEIGMVVKLYEERQTERKEKRNKTKMKRKKMNKKMMKKRKKYEWMKQ